MDDETIICTCMNVSVADIKRAIASGAKSFAEIQEITGVSTVCGLCLDEAEALIENLLNES